MGKGKGKLKKNVTIAAHEQTASGGEEKIIPLTRRGRPRKLLKKEIEEKEEIKMIDEEEVVDENERKRKRSSEIEESLDIVKDENGAKTRAPINDSVKFVGFRQSGSRRKNKPRRAAEVGVECF